MLSRSRRLPLLLLLLLLPLAAPFARALSLPDDHLDPQHDLDESDAALPAHRAAHPAEPLKDPDSDFQFSNQDAAALGIKLSALDPDQSVDLSDSLKSFGLTDAELAELKKMEEESNREDGLMIQSPKDERMVDAQPPPGMVAGAGEPPLRKDGVGAGTAGLALGGVDRAVPRPHEPREGEGGGDGSEAAEAEGLKARMAELEAEMKRAKKEASEARAELKKSKKMFEEGLRAEKEEHRIEREELTSAIEERKRAFDELFEEKQLLGKIVREEQVTLHKLQDKIQHPDLGLWMRQRAERAAILVETPETDAMKFYARKYMAPKMSKMGHRLALLEKRVEKSVDHLLPAQYGSVVAVLLSIGLVGFPVFVTMTTVVSVTKSVSLRQYVLLGNVFLAAFSSGLCIAGLILRQDPLQTLYEASESVFMILQIATALAFPVFVGVIVCAVVKARDQEDLFVFGCELVFYVLVGLNYRARVWRPAMLGENIETSRMMYALYVIDFLSMTALTISSAKMDRQRLPTYAGEGSDSRLDISHADSKPAIVTGSSSLPSARAGMSSVGNGLKSVMTGGGAGGKEE